MSTITDIDGNPVQKPFSWSFSALSNFKTCPKQFYHLSIKKDVKEGVSEHRTWGDAVHKAMADRCMHAVPLPPEMTSFEKWVDWAMVNSDRTTTIVRAEQKLAVTKQLQPCEFFDKRVQPWFRTVIDLLKVRGSYARIIDWKTGKVKEDSEQLGLSAAVVFAHFPEVTHCLCQFVWLKDDVKTEDLVPRESMPFFWQRMLPQIDEMVLARETGDYPARPSGLCRRHCPVVSCPYHGRGI